jgi:hypothetical protein
MAQDEEGFFFFFSFFSFPTLIFVLIWRFGFKQSVRCNEIYDACRYMPYLMSLVDEEEDAWLLCNS